MAFFHTPSQHIVFSHPNHHNVCQPQSSSPSSQPRLQLQLPLQSGLQSQSSPLHPILPIPKSRLPATSQIASSLGISSAGRSDLTSSSKVLSRQKIIGSNDLDVNINNTTCRSSSSDILSGVALSSLNTTNVAIPIQTNQHLSTYNEIHFSNERVYPVHLFQLLANVSTPQELHSSHSICASVHELPCSSSSSSSSNNPIFTLQLLHPSGSPSQSSSALCAAKPSYTTPAVTSIRHPPRGGQVQLCRCVSQNHSQSKSVSPMVANYLPTNPTISFEANPATLNPSLAINTSPSVAIFSLPQHVLTSPQVQQLQPPLPAQSISLVSLPLGNIGVLQSSSSQHPASLHGCKLCDITCFSEEQMKRHLRGKRHEKKLKDREYRTLLISHLPEGCTDQYIQSLIVGYRLDYDSTEGCPVTVTTTSQKGQQYSVVFVTVEELQQFLATHINPMTMLGQQVHLQPACLPLCCEICQLQLNSEFQMAEHVQGKQHLRKMREAMSRNNNTVDVDVQGLSQNVTLDDLTTFFQEFHVTPRDILFLPIANDSEVAEVFCMVSFHTLEEAIRAVATKSGQLLRDCEVTLNTVIGSY